ncbi:MAG: PDZ domain-containing protein [Actinomycetota bacterium]
MDNDPSSLPGGGFGDEADPGTGATGRPQWSDDPLRVPWVGREEFDVDADRAWSEQQAWLDRWGGNDPSRTAWVGRPQARPSDVASQPQSQPQLQPVGAQTAPVVAAEASAVASVPAGTEAPADSPWDGPDTHRAWRWAGVFLAVVVGLGVLGGMALKVPYVALVPGSAKDTEPLVEVAGADQYPSDGELLFTTVRVRQRPNLWEYLWLKADDDANVVPEDDILGGRSPEENREFNLGLMNDSKRIAIAVALNELGFEAVTTDAVVVQQLVPDTPAEEALVLGDSILSIDGLPTTNTGELVEILAGRAPGDTVGLSVQRFGEEEIRDISVVLAANPDRPEAGFLGIQPADRPRYLNDVGFTVDIDSGSVGGPSAGLAFTLAVLDQLTPGELTGGVQVAVTGTINAAGDVGPVGGVLQKTAAVEELGVDVFIVPAALGEAELEAIEARAGDDLQIVPVFTLGEALDALAGLGGDVAAVQEYAAANTAN